MTVPKPRRPRPGSVADLCIKLGHAIAQAQAIPDHEEEKAARAVKRCDNLGRRLLLRPSNSIDDMLTKIMVAGYFPDAVTPKRRGDREGFSFEPNWDPGRNASEELLALASLRGDLRRLKRGKVRIAS
jgi:hypothetical protein